MIAKVLWILGMILVPFQFDSLIMTTPPQEEVMFSVNVTYNRRQNVTLFEAKGE